MIDPNDKAYADIGATPIGRIAGQMFRGMVEEGMTRAEALDAVKFYLYNLTSRPESARVDSDETER